MHILEIDIFSTVDQTLRSLGVLICKIVYPLIAGLYSLFINISKVNILSDESMKDIYYRITMILTIIMVFYVTFEFVKFVVQPDNITDKEKGAGNIVFKMGMVVVLIAFVPTIFTWAGKLQNVIIDQEIFSKVLLGKKSTSNSVDARGKEFAADVLSKYYYVAETNKNLECVENSWTCSDTVEMNLLALESNGELPGMATGINTQHNGEYIIHFNYIFAIIVGVLIAYILLLYCVDVGTRWAQLIFLQIISPIPIIGYLSPKKDGIFQKWVKQCFTTYLDLFIRIAIIYFILFITGLLQNAFEPGSAMFNKLGDISDGTKNLIYIALVLGLLVFAKKAPKMLGELFPKMGAASGNFGLKAGDRGVDKLFGGALGVASGAAWGVATGAAQGWRRFKGTDGNIGKRIASGVFGAGKGVIGGAVGGSVRGLYHGTKKGNPIKNGFAGAKSQAKANQRFGNREEAGYSMMHQAGDAVRSAFHMPSRVEELENKKAPIKRHSDTLKRVADTEAQIKKRALEKIKEGSAKSSDAQNKARELARAEDKLRELEDPNASKKLFKVSKYKTDEEAYDAYIEAVKDARSQVNRQNFINPDGTLNSTAYENECNRAAAKVNQEDFKAGKYKTEEEAKQALAEAIDKARNELDEAQKNAVAAYVKQSGTDADAAITTMVNELKTHVKKYNDTASTKIEVDYDQITDDFKAFSKNVKSGEIRDAINKDAQKIIEHDADIEAIKRETAGSGIGEGKK